MKRKILYVSGTRADFGLLKKTLSAISKDSRFELGICVTGMHLSSLFGRTVQEIEDSGLPILGRFPVKLDKGTGLEMATSVGEQLSYFASLFDEQRPDIVLLLGDRGEMLAGAIAAIYQNIPIVHLHGGERSGTVDEPVRHAISKLAHYHFVATQASKNRLVLMGESEDDIFVTGAPGLDGITDIPKPSRSEWCEIYRFDPLRPIALMVFHPVVQTAHESDTQVNMIIECAVESGVQMLCIMPNSDAGSEAIRRELRNKEKHSDIRVLIHLKREDYLVALATVDVLLGNSSSGIIEAASFNLPVINIGNRQKNREQNENVVNSSLIKEEIMFSINKVLSVPKREYRNIYGDGSASETICELLATLPLDGDLLEKANAY